MCTRFCSILTFFLCVQLPATAQPHAPEIRFADEIKAFKNWDLKNAFPNNGILFVGSSSIRMWNTAAAFPGRAVINRGFGGAVIEDVLFHYDVVVKPYAPRVIVFYCGDNDVSNGLSPDSVLAGFDRFLLRVRSDFPKTTVVFVAVKPSPSRWSLWPAMAQVNTAVSNRAKKDRKLMYADIATPMLKTGSPPASGLFLEDGLHLSEEGYALWAGILETHLKKAGL
jgi:lysophospholipase L1-like esterase